MSIPSINSLCENIFEKIEDQFTCSVCLDIFTDPRVLPKCSHTFCSKCIENVLNKKKECPECRGSLDYIKNIYKCPIVYSLSGTVELVKELRKELNNRKVESKNEAPISEPISRPIEHEILASPIIEESVPEMVLEPVLSKESLSDDVQMYIEEIGKKINGLAQNGFLACLINKKAYENNCDVELIATHFREQGFHVTERLYNYYIDWKCCEPDTFASTLELISNKAYAQSSIKISKPERAMAEKLNTQLNQPIEEKAVEKTINYFLEYIITESKTRPLAYAYTLPLNYILPSYNEREVLNRAFARMKEDGFYIEKIVDWGEKKVFISCKNSNIPNTVAWNFQQGVNQRLEAAVQRTTNYFLDFLKKSSLITFKYEFKLPLNKVPNYNDRQVINQAFARMKEKGFEIQIINDRGKKQVHIDCKNSNIPNTVACNFKMEIKRRSEVAVQVARAQMLF